MPPQTIIRQVTENATSQAVPDGNTAGRDGELPEPF